MTPLSAALIHNNACHKNTHNRLEIMFARTPFIAVMFVAGLASAPAIAGNYNDGLVQEGQLVIATTGNAPPMTMVNEDGTLGGFDVALCGQIAQNLGLEPKFVRVDFAATIPGLKAGRFDMICSAVARTPARIASEDIYLSEPTIENYTTFLVKTDSDIEKIDDVKGKRIGVVRGGQEGKLLEQVFGKDITLTSYPGIAEELLDLRNGRVDAVAMNYTTAAYQVQKDAGLRVMEPGLIVDGASPYTHGIVVARSQPDLLEAVNAELEKMTQNGAIDALEAKWINGK